MDLDENLALPGSGLETSFRRSSDGSPKRSIKTACISREPFESELKILNKLYRNTVIVFEVDGLAIHGRPC